MIIYLFYRAKGVKLVLKVLKDTEVSLVYKVYQVMLDLRVKRVYLEHLAFLEKMVNQEAEVIITYFL